MAVGGIGNIINYGANYNRGTKVGGKFLTREVNAGKLFSKIGLGFKVLGIAGSLVSAESATERYVNSDRSYGRAGQLAVNLIGNTLTNLKHPTLIGIGIAFARCGNNCSTRCSLMDATVTIIR